MCAVALTDPCFSATLLTTQTEEVDLSSGQRLQTKTWRDYLCCCIQPKVVLPPVETQEDQELLPQKHKLRRSDR